MPIFVYRCGCGTTFERLVSRDAAAPDCPSCGGVTRKIPAGPSLAGRAGAGAAAAGATGAGGGAGARGPAGGSVPLPWQGAVSAGPEGMQREVRLRENIVDKGKQYPGNPGSAAASSGGAD